MIHDANWECPTRHEHLIKDLGIDEEIRYRCQACGDLFAPIGELRNALIHAEQAMQSAWYELQPGHCVIGDQFIKKDDMTVVLDLVRKVIRP